MKRLRFLCFASLLALIFALSGVADAPLAAEGKSVAAATPPEDSPSSSVTITITWIPYSEENIARGLCEDDEASGGGG